MISRYSIPEIIKIWSDEYKLNKWLEVEISVVKAWNSLGLISKKDLDEIVKKSKVDINRMLEIEKQTKHDVVAFTRMMSESLGKEKKWIHLGLTSTDIVDTAQNKLIQESNTILKKDLELLLNLLKQKAIKYKETLIMGRSHGMYGEPTSLGLKFLLWYSEIERQIQRFEFSRKDIEVAKISGSMGNHAHLELEIEEFVAKDLGLKVDEISTQVTQRDKHAFLVAIFSNIGSTFEKIATEIRLFQRSEVQEISEGFGEGQKGSSSMPHKKNPISSENICGLARYLKSFSNMAFENNVLWHERDISHSSNERIMFPDMYNTLIYITRRLTETISNLFVNEEIMLKHIIEQKGIYFSQLVMTEIIKKSNKSREQIYDFIQNCTLEAQSHNLDFKEVIFKNNVEQFNISKNDLEKILDNKYFLRNVDKIYKRVLK